MQTAAIIMPLAGTVSKGKGVAHTYIEEALLGRFGGYSEYEGKGAWKGADGFVYREPHIRYEVAFELDGGASWEIIKAIALNAGQVQHEKAVYIQLGQFAEILETGA